MSEEYKFYVTVEKGIEEMDRISLEKEYARTMEELGRQKSELVRVREEVAKLEAKKLALENEAIKQGFSYE